ncbi:MAG TPA: glutathione S-transferase N-terminal domain-containing protein, partial [Burkholderiaceae bacterium]|nr:glutathione S-transferase N-terminal domain-containing protein [Burkholderiaceae bacterium]
MTKLKLTYFDIHGGRGEPARLAMHIGGVAFEDHRFAFPEFAELRKATPFGQVPTLHVDGTMVTQCDAINRYVGKLAGLYPADPYQALLCDEVMYVVEEASVKLGPTFRMTGDEQKEARLALVNGSMPVYLGWLQKQLLA